VGILAVALALAAGDAAKTAAGPPKRLALTGQLLVATTELRDPRFAGTVIYMVRHDARGALGLVINWPVADVPLARLLERLGLDSQGVNGEIRVHYGGPVEPTRAFVLHTADYSIADTQVVGSGIALTSQPEILRAIGTGSGPQRSLLAIGYAGWAPGQLESEIQGGAWIGVPADQALVFDENYEGKWRRAMARRTIDL
jgi:putative transcriptional regulator